MLDARAFHYLCLSNKLHSGWFGSKSELWSGVLEDDELRLKEDVTVDGESDAGVALDTAKAGWRSVSFDH